MGNKLELELPTGDWSTWSTEEWVCNCPFCGKEGKFTWNITKSVGRCWSCSKWISGKNSFLSKFKDGVQDYSFDLDTILRTQHVDNFNRNYLINAWDHPKSKEFLIGRNISEFVSRDVGISYYPPKKTLYLETKPLAKGLEVSYLWRQIPQGKWYHKKGTKSIYYSWGVEKFQGKRSNILLCEGVFDLFSTRLYTKGLALLGSNLNVIWYHWLKKRANKVVLWFDNDAAGHKATKEIASRCDYFGIPFSVILSSKDPKCYDRRIPKHKEFLKFIEEHINSNESGSIIKDEFTLSDNR